jgi:hypothetical protein
MVLVALSLSAAVFVAGCKKNQPQGKGSDVPRTSLKGKIDFEQTAVKSGYLLFLSQPPGSEDADDDSSGSGPKNIREYPITAYGWGKVTAEGKYEAYEVPVGSVQVILYTNPEDFQQALGHFKVKSGGQGRDDSDEIDRGGDPHRQPRGPRGPRGQDGPGIPPVTSEPPSGPPARSGLPPGVGHRHGSMPGPVPDSKGGLPPGRMPGDSNDVIPPLPPEMTRGQERPDMERGRGVQKNTGGGPTQGELAAAKNTYAVLTDDEKAELARANRAYIRVKVTEDQAELNVPLLGNAKLTH